MDYTWKSVIYRVFKFFLIVVIPISGFDTLWIPITIRDFPADAPFVERFDADLQTPKCGGRKMYYPNNEPVLYGGVFVKDSVYKEGFLRDFPTYDSLVWSVQVEVTPNMVQPQLSQKGKPALWEVRCYNEELNTWFSDEHFPTIKDSLPLTRAKGSEFLFEFDSGKKGFFPLDRYHGDADRPNFGRQNWAFWCNPLRYGDPLCIEPPDPTHPMVRNFGFSVEGTLQFTYVGGEIFSFSGDDDMWVFIDGELALDLGGVHLPARDSIELDELARLYDWEPGSSHELKFFYAERQTSHSNLRLTTSLRVIPPGKKLIYATSNQGGRIVPAGHLPVNPGDSAFFKLIPEPGYRIADLILDTFRLGPQREFLLTNVYKGHRLLAQFEPEETQSVWVQIEHGPGGSVFPKGNLRQWQGSSLELLIAPDSGYIIKDILVDGNSHPPTNPFRLNELPHDVQIQIGFAPENPRSIHWKVKHSVGGNVTPTTGSYPAGIPITVQAIAEPGYRIASINLNAQPLEPFPAFRIEDVLEDLTLQVRFEAIPLCTVYARTQWQGYLFPEGRITVFCGESLEFTVQPKEGFLVDYIQQDSIRHQEAYSLQIDSIMQTANIMVYYRPIRRNHLILQTQAEGCGSITPSGLVEIPMASRYVIQITPQDSCYLAELTINGFKQELQTQLILEEINMHTYVKALFKPLSQQPRRTPFNVHRP
jgi:fibro-slime domain-containing protein